MGIFTANTCAFCGRISMPQVFFRTSSLLGKDFKDESKMAEVGGVEAGMTVGSGILAGA